MWAAVDHRVNHLRQSPAAASRGSGFPEVRAWTTPTYYCHARAFAGAIGGIRKRYSLVFPPRRMGARPGRPVRKKKQKRSSYEHG